MLGSGGAFGTVRAQLALRPVLVACEMLPLPKPELYVPWPAQHFDADGLLTDEAVRGSVRELVTALAAWTRRLRAN
jgi:chromate reductase